MFRGPDFMGSFRSVDEFASMRSLTILALKEGSAILRIECYMVIDGVNVVRILLLHTRHQYLLSIRKGSRGK